MGILRDIFTSLGGYDLTKEEENEVRSLETEERRSTTVTKVVEDTKRRTTIRRDELGLAMRKNGEPMEKGAPQRRKSTDAELEEEARMWSDGE